MRTLEAVKQDLFRVIRNALLALFLIPLLSFLFIWHVQSTWDSAFVDGTTRQIEGDTRVAPARKAALEAMIKAVPPSQVCETKDPALTGYRDDVCESLGNVWQFHYVGKVVKITLLLELALCLTLAVLSAMAFRGRDGQYRSLVLSWRLLAWSSALVVVAQSAVIVWLSYWVTAYFFHMYFIKLVVVIGFCAGVAAFAAVRQIFAQIPHGMTLPGELIAEADAPALWARIRALAAQLGTAPPQRIVAGIDANFFVTQSRLTVQGRTCTGSTLYVSLPLLRILDQREADAVLAHELAHFKGGDTESSAALGPKLAQFDTYCARMSGAGLTLVSFFPLVAYRTVLSLAMMRDSREREFMADQAAARCVHPLPLMRALIKVAAYSSYRNSIEQELFQREERHEGAIGIAAHVAAGLAPFAWSPQFRSLMEEASVPHPFDSHPKLQERMDNVACVIGEDEFGKVLGTPVVDSWAQEISSSDAIEGRLWSAYESHFAQVHEQNLCYSYLPQTDAERAIVEQYFPALIFALNGGRTLRVDYAGLDLPDATRAAWSDIRDIKYEDGFGGDVMTLTLTEKGLLGAKSKKVRLPGIKAQRAMFKDALNQYWHRHRTAHGASLG